MYKRFPAVVIAVMVVLTMVGGIGVCAEPALNYSLVYDSCYVHGDYRVQTADGTVHAAEVYAEYGNGDPEGAEVGALVEACREQVTAAMEAIAPSSTVYDQAVLTNGAVHTAPAAYAPYYRTVFGVGDSFGGTQAVALGDTTLQVTGDGAGGLQLQVTDAPASARTESFSANAARTLAVTIDRVQSFHAYYVQQGTTPPASDSYTADAAFDSLDAALAHCEADADQSYPVLIRVQTDCAVRGTGTIGNDFVLTVVYGNTNAPTTAKPTTTANAPVTTRATTVRVTTARPTTARTTTRGTSTTTSTTATSTSLSSTTSATSTTAVPAVVIPHTTMPRGAAVSPPSPFAWDVVFAAVVMVTALAALAVGLYIKHRS